MTWNRRQALKDWATENSADLYLDVSICAPWMKGWGRGYRRVRSHVALRGEGRLIDGCDEEFRVRAAGDETPRLVAVGGLSRSSLGTVIADRYRLSRTFNSGEATPATMITSQDSTASNTVRAFEDEGIEFYWHGFDRSEVPEQGRYDLGRLTSPHTREDRLLANMWNDRDRHGSWFLEFGVGHGSPRRIDALVISPDDPPNQGADLRWAFDQLKSGAPVEVVEAKFRLDATVIGQAVAGRSMLIEQFGHAEPKMAVCVRNAKDQSLIDLCAKREITLIAPEA